MLYVNTCQHSQVHHAALVLIPLAYTEADLPGGSKWLKWCSQKIILLGFSDNLGDGQQPGSFSIQKPSLWSGHCRYASMKNEQWNNFMINQINMQVKEESESSDCITFQKREGWRKTAGALTGGRDWSQDFSHARQEWVAAHHGHCFDK